MNKKLVIIISLSMLILLAYFGLGWYQHFAAKAEVSDKIALMNKSVRYKQKEAGDMIELLKTNKLLLENSKKLYLEYKESPYLDIRIQLEVRLKIDELVWKISKEQIEHLSYTRKIQNISPAEYLAVIDQTVSKTKKAIKHFQASKDFISETRETLRISIQDIGLDAEDKQSLWALIDSRTRELSVMTRTMKYPQLTMFMQKVLVLQIFLQDKKESIRITKDNKLSFLESADYFQFRLLAQRVKFELDNLTLF